MTPCSQKELAGLVQQVSNLLALDQASLTSGFAVFKDGELFDHGKFTFDDDDIAERLVKIRKKVIELIEKYDAAFIAYTDSINSNTSCDKSFIFLSPFGLHNIVQEADAPGFQRYTQRLCYGSCHISCIGIGHGLHGNRGSPA